MTGVKYLKDIPLHIVEEYRSAPRGEKTQVARRHGYSTGTLSNAVELLELLNSGATLVSWNSFTPSEKKAIAEEYNASARKREVAAKYGLLCSQISQYACRLRKSKEGEDRTKSPSLGDKTPAPSGDSVLLGLLKAVWRRELRPEAALSIIKGAE